jgi:ABC-type lipoprotein release transport system permease subunit
MSTSWDANVTLSGNVFDADPYLAYQPAFAYTLPIQLLVAGITVTLLCVLLIHLLCTWAPAPS